MAHPAPSPLQRGLTLIELVMFMVVLSAALAGVLRVFIQAGAHSADPLQRRQALAVAESLLEEIELMPYTYCDPDDAIAPYELISTALCTTTETMGPESGETRFGPTQFDNVNDYNGYAMNGAIVDITNTPIAALAGYSASVTVAAAALGNSFYQVTAANNVVLKITVTVTSPDGNTVALDGYRSFYAASPAL